MRTPLPALFVLTVLLLAQDATAMSAAMTTDAACDWKALALPEHARMVEAPREQVLQAAQGSVDSDEAYILRSLLQRPSLPVGELQGQWQVRSLQFTRMFGDTGQVYVYPFFRAMIDRNPCGYHLAKVSGSQRRSGQLYRLGNPDTLAFLGASTINAQTPGDYDPKRPPEQQSPGDGNSAGSVYRIGADELLIVLDVSEDGFEVYHLKR